MPAPFTKYRPYPYTNHPGPRTPGPKSVVTYGAPQGIVGDPDILRATRERLVTQSQTQATVAQRLTPLRLFSALILPLGAAAGYIRSGSLLFAIGSGLFAPAYLIYLGLLKVSGEKKVLKRRKNGRKRNAGKRHHRSRAAYHRGALDAHRGRTNGRKRRKKRRRNRR